MKIIFLFLLVLQSAVLFGQKYQIGDTLTVNAYSGLNMRTRPDQSAKVITLTKYGEKLIVTTLPTEKNTTEINTLSGNWIKVSDGINTGYVFDGYLTRLPVVDNEKVSRHNTSVIDIMESYAKQQIGIVDTTYYTNGIDGERAMSMVIYDLKGGHQYIEKGYWEGLGYELQLNHVRTCEGFQLLNNLIRICGITLGPWYIEDFSGVKSQRVDIEKGTYLLFEIAGYNGRFIIKITSKP